MRSLLLRGALGAATALSVASSVSGCTTSLGQASEPTGGLAIVVGARSNTPPPVLGGAAARARDIALQAQSLLSVIVADGQPYQVQGGILVIDGKNGTAREQQQLHNRQVAAQVLSSARAKASETDLLTALGLAARWISSSSGVHTIVVLDSGLSTTGAVDFTRPGMLDADPSEVADYLARTNELPDLAGDDVVFQGLGDVAPRQARLDEAHRKNLIAIWTAVAKAAHAGTVTIEQTPLQGAPAAGLPPVRPVPVPSPATCIGSTVTLTGGAVAFKPDSAEFLDPTVASTTLQPIAEQMIKLGLRARLTGTTANVGSMSGQQSLSGRRAKAVLDLLVELHVPASRMTSIGLGSDFPGYVQDHDAPGHLIPWAAAANRKVIVDLNGQVACPHS